MCVVILMFKDFTKYCLDILVLLELCISVPRALVYRKIFMKFNLGFSVDPFTRKDWYDVKAPSMFATRQIGKTLVNRTQGTSEFSSF